MIEERANMDPKFINPDRETPLPFPTNMEEWLPEGHLARFVVDIVNRLDLSDIYATYSEQTKGQKAYDPKMMVSLIFYCLITGLRVQSLRLKSLTT
jgi:transposase